MLASYDNVSAMLTRRITLAPRLKVLVFAGYNVSPVCRITLTLLSKLAFRLSMSDVATIQVPVD